MYINEAIYPPHFEPNTLILINGNIVKWVPRQKNAAITHKEYKTAFIWTIYGIVLYTRNMITRIEEYIALKPILS